MEIPLLFPTLNDGVTRYLLDAAHGSWSAAPPIDRRGGGGSKREIEDGGGDGDPSSALLLTPPSHWTAAPSLKGASSVCRLRSSSDSTSSDALLTTVLLEETPWVLSVSVLAGTFTHSIELDLSASTGFQGITRAKAFPEQKEGARGSGVRVRLVLVDRNGVVLKVLLDWDSDAKALRLRRLSQHSWTSSGVVPLKAVNLNSLNHARVGFLSSGKILLALTPFLFSLDVDRGDDVVVWYRGKCLDYMKKQRSFFSIAGRPDHGNVVDMGPVAALTVAEHEEEAAATVVVHTLHSDGQLRRWILGPHSTEPSSLHESRPESLPRPEHWGGEDEHNAPMLASRLYNGGQVCVCAIYVPDTQGSCHLSVVHGYVSSGSDTNSGTTAIAGGLNLAVPPRATSLIGMEFDAHSPKCSLLAWFHQTQAAATTTALSGDDGASTVCLHYPPSHVSILCSQPKVFDSDDLLDRLAWKERQEIRNLQPLGRTYLLPLEDALHQVDRQFLRRIFRPLNRALPPSASHIRSALAKTVRSATTARLGSRSVELEVVTVVHERREEDDRRILLLGPATPKQRRVGSGVAATPYQSTPASARTDVAFATPGAMTLYDSIGWQGLDDEMDRDDDFDDDARAILTDDEDDASAPGAGRSSDVAKEINRHAARWRQLLLLIWEEEQALRVPLLLTSATLNQADVAVTIRSGTVSLLVPSASISSAVPHQASPLVEFDRCASDIMSFIESEPSLGSLMAALEREHLEIVSTVELAIAEDREVWCYGKLNLLVQQLVSRGYQVAEGDWLYELGNAAEDEFIAALEQTSASMLRINTPICGDASQGGTTSSLSLEHQSRLAIFGVTARNLEYAQRLLLGRCLLLVLEPISQNRAFEASVRMYLHTMVTRWAMAQHVTNPRYSLESARRERDPMLPPQKRLSLDAESSGILNSRESTCVLDALLLQLSHDASFLQQVSGPVSTTANVLAFSGEVIRICLRFYPTTLMGKAIEPPELGILATVYTHHPKLQLLLLAPHITFNRPDDDPLLTAERIKKIASALLDCASSEPETRARRMVAKAFDLLPFDPENEERSKRHLKTLNDAVGAIFDEVVVNMALDYLDRAIASMEAIYSQDLLNRNKLYDSLLDSVFHFSLKPLVQNWDRAFNSCVKNPNVRQRAINLRFLAGAMVSNGALSELIKLCKSNVNEDIGFGIEELRSNTNLYEIAADALSDLSHSHTDRLRGLEDTPKYQEALYALHASKGEWKRAAQALDSLYMDSLTALQLSPPDSVLDVEIACERQRLIIDDLLVSSLGCLCAVTCVKDIDFQFVRSGERPEFISLPAASVAEGSPVKRQLGETPISLSARTSKLDANNAVPYLGLNELELRSAVVSAVSLLHDDERTDPKLKKLKGMTGVLSWIGNGSDVVDALMSRGYYDQALIVSRLAVENDTRGSQLYGRSAFHESLLHLLCSHLVPLSLGATTDFTAPSLAQLSDAIDALSSAHSGLPPLVVHSRSKKLSEIPHYRVCTYAMTLVQRLTIDYSSAVMPLAIKVAESYLRYRAPSGQATPLPAWLELLLLRGSDPTTSSSRPGMFASRPLSNQEGFSGDPSALLTLLSRSGMYEDACRVVAALLVREGDETGAPSRLPEKGDVDFVPYDKVDLLWNLIDVAVEQGLLGDKEVERKVLKARSDMEWALDRHFKLLKISEMGQQSARASRDP